ncbi:uncharacterized protein L199_008529 [Kwoniella botswanensis]|uniref:uncharacterized protein n=1 Tax=Kwoniella botswanensis TaxID=1268659 RepID=UPI00315C9849
MQVDNVPNERWERILYFVHRAPPLSGTGCKRKAYRQQDLTVVLRLNRGSEILALGADIPLASPRFFDIAVTILCSNPIVVDPFQFVYGLPHSPPSYCTPFKHSLLRNVKSLDITYRQDLKDTVRKPYYYLKEQERKEWENNFFSRS